MSWPYITFTIRVMGPQLVSEHERRRHAELKLVCQDILADGLLSDVEAELSDAMPEGIYVKIDQN